jgi:hypothetical protein
MLGGVVSLHIFRGCSVLKYYAQDADMSSLSCVVFSIVVVIYGR